MHNAYAFTAVPRSGIRLSAKQATGYSSSVRFGTNADDESLLESADDEADPEPEDMVAIDSSRQESTNARGTIWSKLRFKKKDKDGENFRQKLAKAGLSVVLSYGAVSNLSYGVSMSIAWYGFCRKVRAANAQVVVGGNCNLNACVPEKNCSALSSSSYTHFHRNLSLTLDMTHPPFSKTVSRLA